VSALGALLAAAARALLPAERVGHRVDVPVADGPLQGGPSLSRLVLKLSVLACDNSRLSLTWAAQLTPLTRVLHAGERRRARWRPHGLGAWRASGKVRATLSLRKLGPSLQRELLETPGSLRSRRAAGAGTWRRPGARRCASTAASCPRRSALSPPQGETARSARKSETSAYPRARLAGADAHPRADAC